jgi:AraC family transcriptional regulator
MIVVQERGWTRPIDEPMRFAVLATSAGRCWTGIEAKIFATSGGYARSSPSENHCMSMHLSAPIRAACRFEGPPLPRLQVAGDIDLLPPGSCAAWEDAGQTTMIGMGLTSGLLCATAESMGVDPDRVSIPAQLQLRDPRIEHIGWALKAELESDEPFGRAYAEALGLALASHLLRRYARRSGGRLGDRFSNQRLQRVLEYVHENISQDLSLFELAAIANVSPSHFKVVFKRTFGLPVHQYIIRQRVEYAVRLISQGNLPLSEVAMLAGFANQSHMARLTRRLIGASPAEIRGGA